MNLILSSNVPSDLSLERDGYELVGWSLDSDGASSDVSDTAGIRTVSKNGTVSIQDIAENTESYIPLYAVWKQEAIDKNALQAALTNANSAIVATSTNGTDIETTAKWMTADEKQPLTEADKKALDDAIAAAEAVFNNAGATQDQVDAAKKALDDAKATYEAAKKAGAKTEPASDEKEQVQVMYRVYNPNSGEHFYTASSFERDAVVAAGWNDEGIGWIAPVTSGTPVYRLYSGTDHHYTTSEFERDHLISVGWSYENIGWYSDDSERVPLYRQFNPNVNPAAPFGNSGSHNYTVSVFENDSLVSIGWRAEGVGWHAVAATKDDVTADMELKAQAVASVSSDLMAQSL